ncbi:cadherin-87A isoform X2 [Zootermopsis nevadensis]|nr:cadherin-87A isoform X2 [Zootermopsis nevadensis]
MRPVQILLLTFVIICGGVNANRPPQLLDDINNLAISESTPVGKVLFTVHATDPEGSPVHYGIVGTDRLGVDKDTGEVRVISPLDREVNDTLKFVVTLEDEVGEGLSNNLVQIPVTAIILDENDNAPVFKDVPYEIEVPEDTHVGTTVFQGIKVVDPDIIGDILEVTCIDRPQFPDACSKFKVKKLSSNEYKFLGALILQQPLDYSVKPFYQLLLSATDGEHNSSTGVQIKVQDVQNSPPVFEGSLTGVVREDADIGTPVMTIKAHDGDKEHPRKIVYELVENYMDYFLLDPKTGELRTAKPLDKEALDDSTGVINITVRAHEVVDGVPGNDPLTVTTKKGTVTIKDVNDEAPTFNNREYSIVIPENVPDGTPLPHLDMVVRDPDIGTNSEFTLRLDDVTGAFEVEPTSATGSTSVSIRVANGSLDYENPNQRKFIILVIAEEKNTNPRLSSTATVIVSIADANDNVPVFQQQQYTASVSEMASPGTLVTTIMATDRDSGQFGENGIVYQLSGTDADKFSVNNKTGVITVAECSTPGSGSCLDFETKQHYYLTYKAIDDDGNGHSTVASLMISVLDSNDNTPQFTNQNYQITIDEGATKFEPPLQVQARDADKTSHVTYSIIEGNVNNLFSINPLSGEITVSDHRGLDMTNVSNDVIVLTVQASDGMFSSVATVTVAVHDVNNNHPVFGRESYVASVQEDAAVGTSVEQVTATDADSGVNAEIKYRIQKGGFEDFKIDEETGVVAIANKLDFDHRSTYNIEIIAVDGGSPVLTGTATLTIMVLNSNDKDPYFDPSTQRAEVQEDTSPGTVFYTLMARDPDMNGTEGLNFAAAEPITAVDKNGKQITDTEEFKSFFAVDLTSGEVTVMRDLDRDIAAVVRITVLVTDTTAPTTQQGKGTLVITIIDVNDFAPTFSRPWTKENPYYMLNIPEEQPIGSIVDTFVASDVDSNIAAYAIDPVSEYFEINNATGVVRTRKRIDYETVKIINFTVVAYDSGIPQKSATAYVSVNVININDMDPVFSEPLYEATVMENALQKTPVITVTAKDGDEGVFGSVTYSLVGEHSSDFSVNYKTGEVTVANPDVLDRETTPDITIQVMASDDAPPEMRRTVAVPIHIRLIDANDNTPVFIQKRYQASVMENLRLDPPAPILQVHAEDLDEGNNGAVSYTITSGNEGGVFKMDPETGILYPAESLEGKAREFHLVVEGRDEEGNGPHADKTIIDIEIRDVNQNKPVFIMPSLPNATIEVPENAGLPNFLVITVKATDKDQGENGQISYHFKVGNENVQETEEFAINADTGELRAKIILDREVRAKYELVLVAKDHGTPISHETLRFLTVLLVDTDDNRPEFPVTESTSPYSFHVTENSQINVLVGKVTAADRDVGKHAKIYYYIMSGNENGSFSLDRTTGSIYTNTSFDREETDEYNLLIKATNYPQYYASEAEKNNSERDTSIAHVRITILDENDNPPKFEHSNYYSGVNAMANINEFVAKLSALDPDAGDNGTLSYYIKASNLFKFGSNLSRGSIIPSPFNVTEDGKLVTANYMAEYNQDRFVLDIVAKEKALPEREATTKVHVWIFEPNQLIRVILSRPPKEVHHERDEIIAELSNVTGSLVVVDDIRYHVDSSGHIHHDWCDMYLHVVDGPSQTIASIPEVLKVIDAKYDFLKDYYAGFAIENVLPAFVGVHEEPFDPALAALIALLIVLFVGCITFVVVCCCLRHWVITAPSDLKKKEALIKKEIIDDLNTTENPLWIEQKLKLYEEQELTMQVFCEPENLGIATTSPQPPMERPESEDFSQVDNTYATIQHPTRRGSLSAVMSLREDVGDYATLSGGMTLHNNESAHGSVRSTPRDMYEASLGFQGSTFQVPDQPLGGSNNVVSGSNDPFRPRTALTINKDGQPEFVAELI